MTFNTENVNNLKSSCEKIIKLLNESQTGDYMYSQLDCLAENITDFVNNPIVKNSGIVTVEVDKR